MVCGLRNEKNKNRLLNENNDLTFEKAKEIAVNIELTDEQLRIMKPMGAVHQVIQGHDQRSSSNNTNYVSSNNYYHRRSKSRQNYDSKRYRNRSKSAGNKKLRCFGCEKEGHVVKDCRVRYHKCQKSGHISKNCYENKANHLVLGNLNSINGSKPLTIVINIENKNVEMELDSGASISVMSYFDYNKYFSHLQIIESNNTVKVITGHNVEVAGVVTVKVFYENVNYQLELVIVKSNSKFMPLLGRTWLDIIWKGWRQNFCKEVNMINKNDELYMKLKSSFPDAFAGNLHSPIRDFTVDIALKDGYRPIFFKPYSVPFGLRDKVGEEIERLVKSDIIYPVRYTDWASPISVFSERSGIFGSCFKWNGHKAKS